MPNWMIPNRTTSSTGRTRTNSTIVCPFSSLVCTRLVMFVLSVFRSGWAPLGPTPSGRLEEADDLLQDALDPPRQHREGGDDGECDDPQHDGVLGHRLALFTLGRKASELLSR